MERVAGNRDDEGVLLRLGGAIRAARKATGMSQEAFADLIEIDRSHMGKIERGERNLSLLNLKRIADGLGVMPSELLRTCSL